MKPDVRLPAELAALREIRRRASRHCQCTEEDFLVTLAELKEALDWMARLEAEALANRRYELLPPPNVNDRGE
jgi:hypothetical protein